MIKGLKRAYKNVVRRKVFQNNSITMHLNFRNKILLPFGGLIALSITIIIVVVSLEIKQKIKTALVHNIHSVFNVLQEYQKARLELLKTRGLILSEEPRLKAALDTKDTTTVFREAEKFKPLIETDFLVLTDPEGVILTQMGDLKLKNPQAAAVPSIQEALLLRQSVKLYSTNHETFQIISTPVTILNPFGENNLLGTISIGYRIGSRLLSTLHSLTDCEIGFVSLDSSGESGGWMSSSYSADPKALDSSAETGRQLLSTIQNLNTVAEVIIDGEKHLAIATAFSEEGGPHYLILMQSLDEALKPILNPTRRLLLLVGLAALAITLMLSLFLAGSITSPVTRLVNAIQRVSQGDLDSPVAVSGEDEIGHLAKSFESMRISLKQNIENLEKTYKRLVVSEKLATTGKLFAHLSHELNNPIHNIQSALESASRKASEKSKALVEIAYDEVKRLERIVRSTLDFYRPGSQERIRLNVNDVLSDLVKVTKKHFDNTGIRVIKHFDSRPCQVDGNPDQLNQVFLNLLLNAKEAMPDGGEIGITTVQEHKHIRIDFRDTGCGIPADHKDKIFDAFFTTKSEVNGVGLGLSVSYEIIHQHRGEIRVEADLPKGALFIITLPKAQENDHE